MLAGVMFLFWGIEALLVTVYSTFWPMFVTCGVVIGISYALLESSSRFDRRFARMAYWLDAATVTAMKVRAVEHMGTAFPVPRSKLVNGAKETCETGHDVHVHVNGRFIPSLESLNTAEHGRTQLEAHEIRVVEAMARIGTGETMKDWREETELCLLAQVEYDSAYEMYHFFEAHLKINLTITLNPKPLIVTLPLL